MTCAAIDETAFPDPALLEAVKKVAETPADLLNVTTLDLSNSEVKDLTGLRYLRNLESLNLSNCTSLELIQEQDLSLNCLLYTSETRAAFLMNFIFILDFVEKSILL